LRAEQASADVELEHGGKAVKLEALVDTGASRSVISRRIAEELGAYTPLKSHTSSKQQTKKEN